MAHDVFISYATEDKAVADAICGILETNRIRCWIAPRDILPGSSYGGSIIKAINEARLMVLVFSSSSNQSKFCLNEVERAVSKGIPIIPFRIEDVIPTEDMEFFVSRQHWLDALTRPLELHINKLAETVKVILTGSAGSYASSGPSNHTSSPSQARTTSQDYAQARQAPGYVPHASSTNMKPLPAKWVKWGRIRRNGKASFVLKYGLAGYGLPIGLLSFILLLSTPIELAAGFSIAVFLLGGGAYGMATWSRNERLYAEKLEK